MNKGKEICDKLKEIRLKIAEENGIPLEEHECNFQGNCIGTCPRCEAEAQYLEQELSRRHKLGKAAILAGISLSIASCTVEGDIENPYTNNEDSTNRTQQSIYKGEQPTNVTEDLIVDTLPNQK